MRTTRAARSDCVRDAVALRASQGRSVAPMLRMTAEGYAAVFFSIRLLSNASAIGLFLICFNATRTNKKVRTNPFFSKKFWRRGCGGGTFYKKGPPPQKHLFS